MSVVVGRVAAIWRYPVKSMAGEQLDSAYVWWRGIAGDRRWAFLRPDREHSGFPWLTLRQRPDLVRYVPSIVDESRPDKSPVLVQTPTGRRLDVLDPALAAELGDGVTVMKLNRGAFDAMPLTVMTTRSLDAVSALAGVRPDARRFRPNLVIETEESTIDFAEDGWLGRVLRIGDAGIRLDQRDRRCMIVNQDPDDPGRRDPSVLRVIAAERGLCLGVYSSAVTPGTIAVGSPVTLD